MNIRLRLLQKEEYPLTMAWRSNPDIYKGFYQQERTLTWEEHLEWHNSRNSDWRNFIIMYDDRPVGIVTISQLDHWEPEIGFYIGETSLWGKGVGKEAVRLGLEYIKEQGKVSCHTTVLDNNERSMCLMKSLGFEVIGKAREGETWVTVRF